MLLRMGDQGPGGPGDGVARLVLAARDDQLDIGAGAVGAHPARDHHGKGRALRRLLPHLGDMGVDRGRGGVAARLDLRVARIVGTAVDHRLADVVHMGRRHAGQPGDGLQRLGRDRHGEIGDEVAGSARFQLGKDGLGAGGKDRLPVRLDRARAQRRKQDAAFLHVRRAVLAHHVLAHQPRHQPLGLQRGEGRDAFLLGMNVVAPGDQRGAQFRHVGDGRLRPHPGQRRVGIGGEGGEIDVEFRCIGHGGSAPPRLGRCHVNASIVVMSTLF